MTYAVLSPTPEERLEARTTANTILKCLTNPGVADVLAAFTVFAQLCIECGMTKPEQIDHLCSEFLTRTHIAPPPISKGAKA